MKKNNSKFELIVVILLVMIVVAFLMIQIISGAGNIKYKSLINSASSFTRAVNSNLYSFENEKKVYLDEAVDEKYLSNIKSPFSLNNCDNDSSFVEMDDDGVSYTTLKCDSYLLYRYNDREDNYTIYKVSDWSQNKKKGYVKTKLYNCIDKNDGKELLNNYVEADYFLYKYNKKYDTQYINVKDVPSDSCTVDFKYFYRNEVKVKKSS